MPGALRRPADMKISVLREDPSKMWKNLLASKALRSLRVSSEAFQKELKTRMLSEYVWFSGRSATVDLWDQD